MITEAIHEILDGTECDDEFYRQILDKMVVSDGGNIDVYLNLLPMKWSYSLAKDGSREKKNKKAPIFVASVPTSVKMPQTFENGMEYL